MNLAIDIGFGNVVHVDQGQLANPTSGQCFSDPRTHATNAHN